MKKEKKEELKIEDFIEYLPYGLEMYNSEMEKKILLYGIDSYGIIEYTDNEGIQVINTDTFEIYKPLLNPFTPENMVELAKFFFKENVTLLSSRFDNEIAIINITVGGQDLPFAYHYIQGCFHSNGNVRNRNKSVLIKARKMHLDLNGLLFNGLAANKKEVDKPKLDLCSLDSSLLRFQLKKVNKDNVINEIYTASLNALEYVIELIDTPGNNIQDVKQIMFEEIEKIKELKTDIANNK